MIKYTQEGEIILTDERGDIAQLRSECKTTKIKRRIFSKRHGALVAKAARFDSKEQAYLKLKYS